MRNLKRASLLLVPLLSLFLFVEACATHERAAYNTLYGLEESVTSAYDSYLYGVIRGQFKTNDVPVVSQNYDRFQIGMRVAVVAAQVNPTNVIPHDVIQLGNIVLHSIAEAKNR
jgi:hypothetical protein